jgi:hypothetical protein
MRNEQHMAVVRPREEVQRQLAQAWERLDYASEEELPSTMRELHDVDAEAFSLLIEAMVQLGQPVDEELQQLAGMVSVDEATAP